MEVHALYVHVHVLVCSDSQIHISDLDTDFCLLVFRKLLRINSKYWWEEEHKGHT